MTEYFTVDSKAKSLHVICPLFRPLSKQFQTVYIPQSNTIFHNKCQIQTSVLMSRAIHEAISSWLFQDLSIVKKKWDFEVLGITRLFDLFARVLIPGDGKQIRVQICCETFY